MGQSKDTQKWFKNNVRDGNFPYTLDKNQAKIVCDTHKNTLVTARAGSGKTRTIVAKIIYLLAHDKVKPSEIIVFAFNKKACQEINERLTKITYKNQPLFKKAPFVATTFHAFAYQTLGGKSKLEKRLLTEEAPSQFITRAEQQFFKDYQILCEKIEKQSNPEIKATLQAEFKKLKAYHEKIASKNKLNFNQLVALAAEKLVAIKNTPYKYIFIDEYQDFSLLFLTLTKALRKSCPDARLLAVGDDWQAINRFAGSDVDYFLHFEKYFPENHVKLFIPTNYRSGKKLVKNANYFMSRSLKDYAGCKAKNRLKSKIYYHKVENYPQTVQDIISKYHHKTIKILSRNNDLRFKRTSLENFVESLNPGENELSCSTIHRSKGLEADIVILLEVDPGKFPSPDKTHGLYEIFGDTEKTLLADESRMFYVALTRAKEKLYILSKNPKVTKENQKYNFFSYLNPDFLDPLF